MEKEFYSIGHTAKLVHMTSETLRHYDRIGLVKPSKVDKYTNYRYYNAEDIIRLNTVHALQQMNLPLVKIKEILEYDDLKQIISFLNQAEEKADEKIASLQYSKSKIQLARIDYEKKLHGWQMPAGIVTRKLPKRILRLADPVTEITVNDLWNYHRHFHQRLNERQKKQFIFEDLAGIYCENDSARYFAVCTQYEEMEELKYLPSGIYLCGDCKESTKETCLNQLLTTAKKEYGIIPKFYLQIVVVTGILQWNYQLQIFIGDTR